jgi:hypothetical protein
MHTITPIIIKLQPKGNEDKLSTLLLVAFSTLL